MYDKIRKPEIGVKDYRRVLTIDPNNALAYFHIGFSNVVYSDSVGTNPTAAIENYGKALELARDSDPMLAADIFFHMGYAYELSGDNRSAIESYRTYIDMARVLGSDARLETARRSLEDLEEELKSEN